MIWICGSPVLAEPTILGHWIRRTRRTRLFKPVPINLDNIEQVAFDIPVPAIYTIHVGDTGGVASQDFSLLVGGMGVITDVVITADDPGGNGTDNSVADDIRLLRNGDNVEVYIDGNFSRAFPYAPLDTITINGSGDDEKLTIDYSGGDPIPFGGITFNGGPGFDGMEIVGGSANDITHEFASASSGHVNIDGSTINYTGLAPITDNMNAINRVFTFTGGSETITLMDGGGAGQSYIDSTLSENVTFNNPSASLTINANGGTGPDMVNLLTLDAAFSATVVVNTSASGDTVYVLDTTGGSYTINGGAGADTFNILGTTSPLTVNGFSGADTANILGTGGAVTVNGGNDNDTFNISSDAPGNLGNVNGIAGALTVNGESGTDVLNVSDESGGADAAGVLSSTQITGLGNAGAITYGTMEGSEPRIERCRRRRYADHYQYTRRHHRCRCGSGPGYGQYIGDDWTDNR